MSRCKWFSTVITMALNRKERKKVLLTRYASTIYRICIAIKTQWIPHWKHLPEHLQKPPYLSGVKRPAGWWLAGELSSNFLSNCLCWDSLASPKTGNSWTTRSRLRMLSSFPGLREMQIMRYKGIALQAIFLSQIIFPDSSAFFQTNQCKLRPTLYLH